MLSKQEAFIETLKSLSDDEISSKLFSGRWSSEQKRWATEWLESRASLKRNAREEKTISIAKEANAVAREANTIASEAKEFARLASASASRQARWAMWAAIIATVAIIIAAMTYIKTP